MEEWRTGDRILLFLFTRWNVTPPVLLRRCLLVGFGTEVGNSTCFGGGMGRWKDGKGSEHFRAGQAWWRIAGYGEDSLTR